MAQKLVYTSSPKGLQPGAYGFCVVAATRGLHDRVASFLASTSGYRRVFSPESGQANLNPVSHTHMLVDNLGQTFRILSRVADAGLDYTNRTNKIASFLLPDRNELVSAGPAALFDVPGLFYTSWNQAPTWFEPTPIPAAPEPASTLCSEWARVMGAPDWGAALAATVYSGAPVALVYEPGRNVDVLKMFQESIHLLPVSMRWNATFSTYFTQAPLGAQCQWKAVLAGSPEEATMRANPRVVIFDLTRPGGAMPEVGLASPNGAQLLTLARGAAPVATPTAVPVPGGVPGGANVPPVANAMPGNAFPPAPQPQGGAAFPPPITNGALFDGSGSSDIYGIQQFPGGTKPLNYGRDWAPQDQNLLANQKSFFRSKRFWISIVFVAIVLAVIALLYKYYTANDSQGKPSPPNREAGLGDDSDCSETSGSGDESRTDEVIDEELGFDSEHDNEDDNQKEEVDNSRPSDVVVTESDESEDATESSGSSQVEKQVETVEESQDVSPSESGKEQTGFESEADNSLAELFDEVFKQRSEISFTSVNGKGEQKLLEIVKSTDKVDDKDVGFLLFDSSGSFYNLISQIEEINNNETDDKVYLETVIKAYGEGKELPEKESLASFSMWRESGYESPSYRTFTYTYPRSPEDINPEYESIDSTLPMKVGKQFYAYTLTLNSDDAGKWMAIFCGSNDCYNYLKRSARIQFRLKRKDLSLESEEYVFNEARELAVLSTETKGQELKFDPCGIARVLIQNDPAHKDMKKITYPYIELSYDSEKTLEAFRNNEFFSTFKTEQYDVELESVELISFKQEKIDRPKTNQINAVCSVNLNYVVKAKETNNKPSVEKLAFHATTHFTIDTKKTSLEFSLDSAEFGPTDSDVYMSEVGNDLISAIDHILTNENGNIDSVGSTINLRLISNGDQAENERLDLGSILLPCRRLDSKNTDSNNQSRGKAKGKQPITEDSFPKEDEDWLNF